MFKSWFEGSPANGSYSWFECDDGSTS